MHTHLRIPVAAVAAILLAAGCGSDDRSTGGSTSTPTSAPVLSGEITVSAAASLTGAFTTIKDEFVAANPGATITINFGSSGQLATQIGEGAPADVAAFADEAPMTTLSDANLLGGPPTIFAGNRLVIVTKPGNPQGIATLADLADAGTVSLCAETAPCGKFAAQVLMSAGVEIPVTSVTRGQDVTATVAALTEGDAEAAIVYTTDAVAAGNAADTVEIADTDNVVARYPIAVVRTTDNQPLAQAFVAFVAGAEGQAALKGAGFLAP